MGTLDTVFYALSARPRREILKMILSKEMSAGDIAGRFDISRPAISQHLGVLKAAKLITERRDGTSRYYRARPEALENIRKYLEAFWDEKLGLLKSAVESAAHNKGRLK